MHVRSLHFYPVKGARGIAADRVDVLAQGMRHDRRFLVVASSSASPRSVPEQASLFLTQREHPRLALVETAIDRDRLTLTLSQSTITIALDSLSTLKEKGKAARHHRVKIWDDEVDAVDVGPEAAAFFSDHLGARCSLVYMPPDAVRQVEQPYAQPGDRVGFADGYPVLVASSASLADLNARLIAAGASPVPMDRFRPNVVVDGEGDVPYAEEKATAMRIGTMLRLRTPKRCARCVVTTIDQETSVASKEPLRMLASYRTESNKVYFAMNAIPDLRPDATCDGSISIAVGDSVTYEP